MTGILKSATYVLERAAELGAERVIIQYDQAQTHPIVAIVKGRRVVLDSSLSTPQQALELCKRMYDVVIGQFAEPFYGPRFKLPNGVKYIRLETNPENRKDYNENLTLSSTMTLDIEYK